MAPVSYQSRFVNKPRKGFLERLTYKGQRYDSRVVKTDLDYMYLFFFFSFFFFYCEGVVAFRVKNCLSLFACVCRRATAYTQISIVVSFLSLFCYFLLERFYHLAVPGSLRNTLHQTALGYKDRGSILNPVRGAWTTFSKTLLVNKQCCVKHIRGSRPNHVQLNLSIVNVHPWTKWTGFFLWLCLLQRLGWPRQEHFKDSFWSVVFNSSFSFCLLQMLIHP